MSQPMLSLLDRGWLLTSAVLHFFFQTFYFNSLTCVFLGSSSVFILDFVFPTTTTTKKVENPIFFCVICKIKGLNLVNLSCKNFALGKLVKMNKMQNVCNLLNGLSYSDSRHWVAMWCKKFWNQSATAAL